MKNKGIEDSGRIDLLKSLALFEPDIKSFLIRINRLPNMIKSNSRKTSQSITLSSIHSSKGLEFDTVYLLDVFDGCIPQTSSNEIMCSEKKINEYCIFFQKRTDIYLFEHGFMYDRLVLKRQW